ncbi:hypothetical protein [Vacuolonema iberomarrocanum]|uniref:hypothetical protein n=1 Tax=Vacuolonema iberomarrocanum TaxID=3454632 RepID=UPI0019FF5DF4|nr:hypothetical protein [filamentous cyanobacterium LEGE 07170]
MQQLSLLPTTMATEPEPPAAGVLGEMAEVFGWDAAVLLCRRYGGHEVYFAATPAKWLVDVVGQEKAEAWSQLHPGERFYLPKGVVRLRADRNRRILQMRRSGISVSEIERRVGLCRAQIYSILNSSP